MSLSLASHMSCQGAVSSWLLRRDATEGVFASAGRGLVLADGNWEVPRRSNLGPRSMNM